MTKLKDFVKIGDVAILEGTRVTVEDTVEYPKDHVVVVWFSGTEGAELMRCIAPITSLVRVGSRLE
jgi:hypothetical protein